MWLYDNRVCRGCGRTAVRRHNCPSCPCNYCKKDGHIADNCPKAQKPKKSRPLGRLSEGHPVNAGPFSNPFSVTPRRKQPQLQPRQIADLTMGSGAAAASSPSGGPSSASTSNSLRRPYLQHFSAPDASLLRKRKKEPKTDNARKKSNTNAITPSSDAIPVLSGSRTLYGIDVSPDLDAEVGYPERLESF